MSGGGFVLSPRRTFPEIDQLNGLNHYSLIGH